MSALNLPVGFLEVLHDSSLTRATPMRSQNGNGELSLGELAMREREIVETALRRTNWNIYGTNGTAALLRIKPTTLVSKMKRLPHAAFDIGHPGLSTSAKRFSRAWRCLPSEVIVTSFQL